MLQIRFIFNCPNDKLELAKDFIENTLSADRTMMDNFLQIKTHIESRLSCKENILINKDGTSFSQPYELSLRNRLGMLQKAEIIKKLNRHESSYEIRIDSAHEHYRIVFFVNDDICSFVFTFGFTKYNFDSSSDTTDCCAFYTDLISKDFISGDSDKWFSEERGEINA